MRWDQRGRPYFCLPKGKKTREVPLSPALARRARAHLARFPAMACTLPWRDPEPPTTELEARQRKPVTLPLVLSSSHGKRINYATFNDRSWKRALAAAGVITVGDQRVEKFGGRVRQYPVYEPSRQDMFHVLRHTYASVQLEAGESIDDFLAGYPSVTREQVIAFLEQAKDRLVESVS
jgi:integrase